MVGMHSLYDQMATLKILVQEIFHFGWFWSKPSLVVRLG